ncbi:MAG TPA: hypothetical protein VML55_00630 [Planctomycetaceae bacterium]|nr:hypothetical protein [Planctomycetaceae bacterium]
MESMRRWAAVACAAIVMALATTSRGQDVQPALDEPVAAPRPGPTADELLSKLPEAQRTPDAEAMVRAIAAGEMGPGVGWFGGGESRFGWEWLRSRYDADGDGAITAEEFSGPEGFFDRLDRDRSGRIEQDDFDWSDSSPYMRQLSQARQLFGRLDESSDGRIDRDEWLAAFDRLGGGDVISTPESLHALLFPPRGSGERPSADLLLAGLVSGEIGSHQPGPAVGDPGPDFELRTHDGQQVIRLTEFRDQKPAVLIFGSFT